MNWQLGRHCGRSKGSATIPGCALRPGLHAVWCSIEAGTTGTAPTRPPISTGP